MNSEEITYPGPNQHCTETLKTGANRGSTCPAKACFYHPVTKEFFCKRHCKLTPTELDRISGGDLCIYDPPLRLHGDIHENMKHVGPDPVGEVYCRYLKGYCNWRLGYPFLFYELPLVSISKVQGFGENFSRETLAICVRDTIEYILSRPDAYEWRSDLDLTNLAIKRFYYERYQCQYHVELVILS